MQWKIWSLVGCLALILSGCSEGTHPVSGTVTLNGEPLTEGYIAFVPKDSGQGGGSDITNGSYSLRTRPGNYRVEITASKMMPLPPGETGMNGEKEEVRQYIPDRYNAKSELTAEVPAPDGKNFKLVSPSEK